MGACLGKIAAKNILVYLREFATDEDLSRSKRVVQLGQRADQTSGCLKKDYGPMFAAKPTEELGSIRTPTRGKSIKGEPPSRHSCDRYRCRHSRRAGDGRNGVARLERSANQSVSGI